MNILPRSLDGLLPAVFHVVAAIGARADAAVPDAGDALIWRLPVIPAKAGIQRRLRCAEALDSCSTSLCGR